MLHYSFLILTPDGSKITTAQFRAISGLGWLKIHMAKYMSDFKITEQNNISPLPHTNLSYRPSD